MSDGENTAHLIADLKFPVTDLKLRTELAKDDRCPECGDWLDTGWECNECGFDARELAYPAQERFVDKLLNAKPLTQ